MTRMPQVTARDLIQFLKAEGFVEDRQSGSHLTLRHDQRSVFVTISRSIPHVTSAEDLPCGFSRQQVIR